MPSPSSYVCRRTFGRAQGAESKVNARAEVNNNLRVLAMNSGNESNNACCQYGTESGAGDAPIEACCSYLITNCMCLSSLIYFYQNFN